MGATIRLLWQLTWDSSHFVINSYLNFKTYFITFINCLDKIVQWKTKCEKFLKGLKCHGWVMGHAWGLHGGTWKMDGWGRNIAPKTCNVLVGYVSGAQATRASKHMPGHPPKLDMFQWVGGGFWGSSFEGHIFLARWTATHTRHVFMSVCSGACAARVWKHMLIRLKASNAFMTCRWCNARVKIYVAPALVALMKKERQDETEFTTKIDGFVSFIPHRMLMYFFAGFFLLSPCVWPNSGFWCCIFLTLYG